MTKWMRTSGGMLNLYGQVLPNLDRHAKGYPRLDALHKLVKRGKTNVKLMFDGDKGDQLHFYFDA